jgi:hypothetical protein
LQKEIQTDKANQKKYALVKTPSPESEKQAPDSEDEKKNEVSDKKKKKKRAA